jgi:hypothetical protein
MKTICVFVDMSIFYTQFILAHIAVCFPCYINSNPVGTYGEAEVSIECRQEDAAAIENLLSTIV